jgi:amino acid transporter
MFHCTKRRLTFSISLIRIIAGTSRVASKTKREPLSPGKKILLGYGEPLARKKVAGTLGLLAVTAIGVGGMIGGGIFAVLGLAISVSGHAVALTMAIGGLIALLTGLSYAQMGLKFRGDGGSFTYIQKGFPEPAIAGVAGWLLMAGYVGTLALYATAFGDYGATLIGGQHPVVWIAQALASAGLLIFLGINLLGAKLSGGVELTVVAIKLTILALFVAVGLWGIDLAHFQPVFNHGVMSSLAAVGLIFVAYEGFELIPNAVDEMKDATKELRPAIVIAILLTTLLYILVAIAAVGNLTLIQIQKDQEYVLAVAAQPKLGHLGFVMIGVAAVLSTASAINATLFGAGRLARVMATEGALPGVFTRESSRRRVPYASLLVLTGLALLFTLMAHLELISVFASATFLLIFLAVNVAALRLAKEIKLHWGFPAAGAVMTAASFCVLIWHMWTSSRVNLYWLAAFYGIAIAGQLALQWRRRRG